MTDTQTVWTNERIGFLNQLWTDGLSASKIAAELGVTRNAVIGKLHRLGLHRGRPSVWTEEKIAVLRSEWAEGKSAAVIAKELNSRDGTKLTFNAVHQKVVRLKLAERKTRTTLAWSRLGPRLDHPDIVDVEIPLEQRKTLMQLDSGACRWPVGEPRSPEFFFCGAPQLDGCSYCGSHYGRSIWIRPR